MADREEIDRYFGSPLFDDNVHPDQESLFEEFEELKGSKPCPVCQFPIDPEEVVCAECLEKDALN